jgi:hypothetical protein
MQLDSQRTCQTRQEVDTDRHATRDQIKKMAPSASGNSCDIATCELKRRSMSPNTAREQHTRRSVAWLDGSVGWERKRCERTPGWDRQVGCNAIERVDADVSFSRQHRLQVATRNARALRKRADREAATLDERSEVRGDAGPRATRVFLDFANPMHNALVPHSVRLPLLFLRCHGSRCDRASCSMPPV